MHATSNRAGNWKATIHEKLDEDLLLIKSHAVGTVCWHPRQLAGMDAQTSAAFTILWLGNTVCVCVLLFCRAFFRLGTRNWV